MQNAGQRAFPGIAGLLRHPSASFPQYRCLYVPNGSNLPLRMLLMNAGFKPQPDSGELVLDSERLAAIELPDWANISYQPAP